MGINLKRFFKAGKTAKKLKKRVNNIEALSRARLDALETSIKTVEARSEERVDNLRSSIRSIERSIGKATIADSDLEILPGTPYSRIALPLEYAPSRDLRPRWGNTQPVIGPIADWFGRFNSDYEKLLQLIRTHAGTFAQIETNFDHERLPEPAWLGVPFSPFDLAALYTMVAHYRPARYVEIGSGISTAFAYKAARDTGLNMQITSIDPEPRAAINQICDEVIRDGLETCDLTFFDKLQPNDILFMDGSHRCFMNSDVTVFIIDILPRIAPGVIIHIHDIVLPWDYPDMFVHWYWSEQYILAAYLIGAMDRLRPILPTAWICRSPEFARFFTAPLVDLAAANDGWRGGGSMWFTKLS